MKSRWKLFNYFARLHPTDNSTGSYASNTPGPRTGAQVAGAAAGSQSDAASGQSNPNYAVIFGVVALAVCAVNMIVVVVVAVRCFRRRRADQADDLGAFVEEDRSSVGGETTAGEVNEDDAVSRMTSPADETAVGPDDSTED